jgi:DNA-binding transcriptional MerR regulator
MLSIGQLAAESGVTAETIRYYEREGILPAPARKGTGQYRQYGLKDLERVQFIRRARELDFSLDDIRELLALAAADSQEPCGGVNVVAKAHLADVNAKRDQLLRLREKLTRLVGQCDQDSMIGDCTLLNALGAAASAKRA